MYTFGIFCIIALLVQASGENVSWLSLRKPNSGQYNFIEDVQTRIHSLHLEVDESSVSEYFGHATSYTFGVAVRTEYGSVFLNRASNKGQLNLASVTSNVYDISNGVNFTADNLEQINLAISNLYYLSHNDWHGVDHLRIGVYVETETSIASVFQTNSVPKYTTSIPILVASQIDLPQIISLNRSYYGKEDSKISFPFIVKVDKELEESYITVEITLESPEIGTLNIDRIEGVVSDINEGLSAISFTPKSHWNGKTNLNIVVTDSQEQVATRSVIMMVLSQQDCHYIVAPNSIQLHSHINSYLDNIHIHELDIEHINYVLYDVTISVTHGSLVLDSYVDGIFLNPGRRNEARDRLDFSGNLNVVNQAFRSIEYISNKSLFYEYDELEIVVSEVDTDYTTKATVVMEIIPDAFPPEFLLKTRSFFMNEDDYSIHFGKDLSIVTNPFLLKKPGYKQNIRAKATIGKFEGNGILVAHNGISHVVDIWGNKTSTLMVEGPEEFVSEIFRTIEYLPAKDFNSIKNGGPVEIQLSSCLLEEYTVTSECSADHVIFLHIMPINDNPEILGAPDRISMTENSRLYPFPNIFVTDVDRDENHIAFLEIIVSFQGFHEQKHKNLLIQLKDIPGIEIITRDAHHLHFKGEEGEVNEALRNIELSALINTFGEYTLEIKVKDEIDGYQKVQISLYIEAIDSMETLLFIKPGEKPWYMSMEEDANSTRLSHLQIHSSAAKPTEKFTYTMSAHAKNGLVFMPAVVKGVTLFKNDTSGVVFTYQGFQLDMFNHTIKLLTYTPLRNWNGFDFVHLHLTRTSTKDAEMRIIDAKEIIIDVASVNDAPCIKFKDPDGPSNIKIRIGHDSNPYPIKSLVIEDEDVTESTTFAVDVTFQVELGEIELMGHPDQIKILRNEPGLVVLQGEPKNLNNMINEGVVVYSVGSRHAPFKQDAILVEVNDRGNLGLGGEKYSSLKLHLDIEWVNSAPRLSVIDQSFIQPIYVSVKDTQFVDLPSLLLSDPDDEIANFSVFTISIEHDVQSSILAYQHDKNSAFEPKKQLKVLKDQTGSFVFMATRNNVNEVLHRLRYTPEMNWIGVDRIMIAANDNDAEKPETTFIELVVEVKRSNYHPNFYFRYDKNAYQIEDLRGDFQTLRLNLTLNKPNPCWRFLRLNPEFSIHMISTGQSHLSFEGTVASINSALMELSLELISSLAICPKDVHCEIEIFDEKSVHSQNMELDSRAIWKQIDNSNSVKIDPITTVIDAQTPLIEIMEDSELDFGHGTNFKVSTDLLQLSEVLVQVEIFSPNGKLLIGVHNPENIVINDSNNTLSLYGFGSDIYAALKELKFIPLQGWNSVRVNEMAQINFNITTKKGDSVPETKVQVLDIYVIPINKAPKIQNTSILEHKLPRGSSILLDFLYIGDRDIGAYSGEIVEVQLNANVGHFKTGGVKGDESSMLNTVSFKGNLGYINNRLHLTEYICNFSSSKSDNITVRASNYVSLIGFNKETAVVTIPIEVVTGLQAPVIAHPTTVFFLEMNSSATHLENISLLYNDPYLDRKTTMAKLNITGNHIKMLTTDSEKICIPENPQDKLVSCFGKLSHLEEVLKADIYYAAPQNFAGYDMVELSLTVAETWEGQYPDPVTASVTKTQFIIFIEDPHKPFSSISFEKQLYIWHVTETIPYFSIPVKLNGINYENLWRSDTLYFVRLTTTFGSLGIKNVLLRANGTSLGFSGNEKPDTLELSGQLYKIHEALGSLVLQVDTDLSDNAYPETVHVNVQLSDTKDFESEFVSETQVKLVLSTLKSHKFNIQNKVSSSLCKFTLAEDTNNSLVEVVNFFNSTYISSIGKNAFSGEKVIKFEMDITRGRFQFSKQSQNIAINQKSDKHISFDALYYHGIEALGQVVYVPEMNFNVARNRISGESEKQILRLKSGNTELECSVSIYPVNDIPIIQIANFDYYYEVSELTRYKVIKLSGISLFDADLDESPQPQMKLDIFMNSGRGKISVDFLSASRYGISIEEHSHANISLYAHTGTTNELNMVLETLTYERNFSADVGNETTDYISIVAFDGFDSSIEKFLEMHFIRKPKAELSISTFSISEGEIVNIGEIIELEAEYVEESNISKIEVTLENKDGYEFWLYDNMDYAKAKGNGVHRHVVFSSGETPNATWYFRQEVQTIILSHTHVREQQRIISKLHWTEMFSMSWNSKISDNVQHNASVIDMKACLESIPGLGIVNVTKFSMVDDGGNNLTTWDVVFLSHDGKDVPLLESDSTMVQVERMERSSYISGHFTLQNPKTSHRTNAIDFDANVSVLAIELNKIFRSDNISVSLRSNDDYAFGLGERIWDVTFPSLFGDVDLLVTEAAWLRGFEVDLKATETVRGNSSFSFDTSSFILAVEGMERHSTKINYNASVDEFVSAFQQVTLQAIPFHVMKNVLQDGSKIVWSVGFKTSEDFDKYRIKATLTASPDVTSARVNVCSGSEKILIMGTVEEVKNALRSMMLTPSTRRHNDVLAIKSSIHLQNAKGYEAEAQSPITREFFIQVLRKQGELSMHLQSRFINTEFGTENPLTIARVASTYSTSDYGHIIDNGIIPVTLTISCEKGKFSLSGAAVSYGVQVAELHQDRLLMINGNIDRVNLALQSSVYSISKTDMLIDEMPHIITIQFKEVPQRRKSIFLLETYGVVTSGDFTLALQVEMSEVFMITERTSDNETGHILKSFLRSLSYNVSALELRDTIMNSSSFPKGSWIEVKKSYHASYEDKIVWELAFFHGKVQANKTLLYPARFQLSVYSDNIVSSEMTAISCSAIEEAYLYHDYNNDVIFNHQRLSVHSNADEIRGVLMKTITNGDIDVKISKERNLQWIITFSPHSEISLITCNSAYGSNFEPNIVTIQKGQYEPDDKIQFELLDEISGSLTSESLLINVINPVKQQCVQLSSPDVHVQPFRVYEDTVLDVDGFNISITNPACSGIVSFSTENGKISINSRPYLSDFEEIISNKQQLTSLRYRGNKNWNGIDTIRLQSGASVVSAQVYVIPVNDHPRILAPNKTSISWPIEGKLRHRMRLRNFQVSDEDEGDFITVEVKLSWNLVLTTGLRESVQNLTVNGTLNDVNEELSELAIIIDSENIDTLEYNLDNLFATVRVSDSHFQEKLWSDSKAIMIEVKNVRLLNKAGVKIKKLEDVVFISSGVNNDRVKLNSIVEFESNSDFQSGIDISFYSIFGSIRKSEHLDDMIVSKVHVNDIPEANQILEQISYVPLPGRSMEDKLMISLNDGMISEEISIVIENTHDLPAIRISEDEIKFNDKKREIILSDFIYLEDGEVLNSQMFGFKITSLIESLCFVAHGAFLKAEKGCIEETALNGTIMRLNEAVESIVYRQPLPNTLVSDTLTIQIRNLVTNSTELARIQILVEDAESKTSYTKFRLAEHFATVLSLKAGEELSLNGIFLEPLHAAYSHENNATNITVNALIGNVRLSINEDSCLLVDNNHNSISFKATLGEANDTLQSLVYYVDPMVTLSPILDTISVTANQNVLHITVQVFPDILRFLNQVTLHNIEKLETNEDESFDLAFACTGLLSQEATDVLIIMKIESEQGMVRITKKTPPGFWIESTSEFNSVLVLKGPASSLNEVLKDKMISYLPPRDWHGQSKLWIDLSVFAENALIDSKTASSKQFEFEINVKSVIDLPYLRLNKSKALVANEGGSVELSSILTIVQPEILNGINTLMKITFGLESSKEALEFSKENYGTAITKNDSSVTLTGTPASVNSTLSFMRYISFNGLTSWRKIQINTKIGPMDSNNDYLWLYISPVSSIPKIARVDSDEIWIYEDSKDVLLPQVYIVDADSNQRDGSYYAINVSCNNGVVSLNEIVADELYSTHLDSGGVYSLFRQYYSQVVFYGTLQRINEALDTLRYSPFPDWNGIDSVIISVREILKAGRVLTIEPGIWDDAYEIVINVESVADGPYIVFSQTFVVTHEGEETPFGQLAIEKAVAVDSKEVSIQIGTLRGIAMLTIPKASTKSMTSLQLNKLQVAYLDEYLQNLKYTSPKFWCGRDELWISLQDNQGSMSNYSHSVHVKCEVPNSLVQGIPQHIMALEDEVTIVFHDDKAPKFHTEKDRCLIIDDMVSVDIDVMFGKVSVGIIPGLSYLNNTSPNEFASTVSFTGCSYTIEKVLRSLSFVGEHDFTGEAKISINFTFLGHTYAENVRVSVAAINDIPKVSFGNGKSSLEVKENCTIDVAAELQGIFITDPDDDGLFVNFSVSNGSVEVDFIEGVDYEGSTDNNLVLFGPIQNLNMALRHMVYRGYPNFNGIDRLIISVADKQSVGRVTQQLIALRVLPENSKPIVYVKDEAKKQLQLNQGETLYFDDYFRVADPEAELNNDEVTLEMQIFQSSKIEKQRVEIQFPKDKFIYEIDVVSSDTSTNLSSVAFQLLLECNDNLVSTNYILGDAVDMLAREKGHIKGSSLQNKLYTTSQNNCPLGLDNIQVWKSRIGTKNAYGNKWSITFSDIPLNEHFDVKLGDVQIGEFDTNVTLRKIHSGRDVNGHFTLEFDEKVSIPISPNATAAAVENFLTNLSSITLVHVEKPQDFVWDVFFLSPSSLIPLLRANYEDSFGSNRTRVRVIRLSQGIGHHDIWRVSTKAKSMPQKQQVRISADSGTISGSFRLSIDLTSVGGTFAETSNIDHNALAMSHQERSTWSPGSGRGESMQTKLVDMLAKAAEGMEYRNLDVKQIQVNRTSAFCTKRCHVWSLDEIPYHLSPQCSRDTTCDICTGSCTYKGNNSSDVIVTETRCVSPTDCPFGNCSLSECMGDGSPCTTSQGCTGRGVCESIACEDVDPSGGHTWSITFEGLPYNLPMMKVTKNALVNAIGPKVAVDVMMSRISVEPERDANHVQGLLRFLINDIHQVAVDAEFPSHINDQLPEDASVYVWQSRPDLQGGFIFDFVFTGTTFHNSITVDGSGLVGIGATATVDHIQYHTNEPRSGIRVLNSAGTKVSNINRGVRLVGTIYAINEVFTSNKAIVYRPSKTYWGEMNVQVELIDSKGLSSRNVVAVHVKQKHQSVRIIVPSPAIVPVVEDSALIIPGISVIADDKFVGSRLFALNIYAEKGTIAIQNDLLINSTLEELNLGLSRLEYVPRKDTEGFDVVMINLSSKGRGIISSNSFVIDFIPRNDPPRVHLKNEGKLVVKEDDMITIKLRINTDDSSRVYNQYQKSTIISLYVRHGKILLKNYGGVHLLEGDLILGSHHVRVYLSYTDIESLSIIYFPSSNYYGDDSLVVTTTDEPQGNSQYNYVRNFSTSFPIRVEPIDDIPIIMFTSSKNNSILEAWEDSDLSLSQKIKVSDDDMFGSLKPVRYIKTSAKLMPQVQVLKTSATSGYGKLSGSFRLSINLTNIGGQYAESEDIHHDAVAMESDELTTWTPGTGRGESMQSKLTKMLDEAKGNVSTIFRGVSLSSITVSRSSENCVRKCSTWGEIPDTIAPDCSHDSDCDICTGICGYDDLLTEKICMVHSDMGITSDCPSNTSCIFNECMSDGTSCSSHQYCKKKGTCNPGTCSESKIGEYTWQITFNSSPELPLIEPAANELFPKASSPIIFNDIVISRPIPRPYTQGNYIDGMFKLSLQSGHAKETPSIIINHNATAEEVKDAIVSLLQQSGDIISDNQGGVFKQQSLNHSIRDVTVKRSLPDIQGGYIWTIVFDTLHPRNRRWDKDSMFFVDGSGLLGIGASAAVSMELVAPVTNQSLKINLTSSANGNVYAKPQAFSFVSSIQITNDTIAMESHDILSLNRALGEIIYRPKQNWNSVSGGENDEIIVSISDREHRTAQKSLYVQVNPVNDAPVLQLPGETYDVLFKTGDQLSYLVTHVAWYEVLEDEETLIAPVTVRDVDVWESEYTPNSLTTHKGKLELFISAVNGTISLGENPSVQELLSGNQNGSFSKVIRFKAIVIAANEALKRLKYVSNPNFYGTDAITISVSDFGNTGGSPLSQTVVLPVAILPVNDVPVLITPDFLLECLEDDQLVIPGISIHDPDINAIVNVTVLVANGKFSLTREDGLDLFFYGNSTGEQESVLTFEGNIADVNKALDDSIYRPNQNFNTEFSEADNITIIVTQRIDSRNVTVTTGSFFVHVKAINDGPSIKISGGHLQYVQDGRYVTAFVDAIETSEDVPLLLDGISIIDVDVSESFQGVVELRVSVSHGNISMKEGNGLYHILGSFNGAKEIIVQGSISSLNEALSQIIYTPANDWYGNDSFVVFVSDLGNSGIGGPLEDTATIPIIVEAVNDYPEWILPNEENLLLNEDGALYLDNLRLIDVDATGENHTLLMNISAAFGSIFVNGNAVGNWVTINGSLAELNNALKSLVYVGGTNWNNHLRNRTDSLTLIANDQGYNGKGGARVTEAVLEIKYFKRLNDAPRITGIPGSSIVTEPCQNADDGEFWPRNKFDAAIHGICNRIVHIDVISIFEDTPLVIEGLEFQDPDATETNGQLLIVMKVSHGNIELQGDVNPYGRQSSLIVKSSLSQLNSFSKKIVYFPAPDYNGYDNLSIWISDSPMENSGVGGALTDEQTIPIFIKAVADPPVWLLPLQIDATVSSDDSSNSKLDYESLWVYEDEHLVISGVRIDHADKSCADLDIEFLVGIHVQHGAISLGGLDMISNIRVVAGDSRGFNTTVGFYGTLDNINNALARITYVARENWYGMDTIQFFVDDLRESGLDGGSNSANRNAEKIGSFPLSNVFGVDFVSRGLIDTASVPVYVKPVNDKPTVNRSSGLSDIVIAEEDTKLEIGDVIVNDVDNDILKVILSSQFGSIDFIQFVGLTTTTSEGKHVLHGETAKINIALSTLSYLGKVDWSGIDVITITVLDAHGASDTLNIEVYVRPVNDPPEIIVARGVDGAAVYSIPDNSTLVLGGKLAENIEAYQLEQHKKSGFELWRSEVAQPVRKSGKWGNKPLDWRYSMVKSIRPDLKSGSSPDFLTPFAGKLFFASTGDTSVGRELWASDGSENGTSLVKDIFPGEESSNPKYLVVHNNILYFSAAGVDMSWNLVSDDCRGRRRSTRFPQITYVVSKSNVWDPSKKYDCPKGSHWASSTEIIRLLGEPEKEMTSSETDQLIYSYQCGWSYLTWKGVKRRVFRLSDSVTSGLYLDAALSENHPPLLDHSKLPTGIDRYENFGGIICIESKTEYALDCEKVPFDPVTGRGPCQSRTGEELWATDGQNGGTFRVADINPGSPGSHPKHLVSFQGWVYFQATTQQHGRELWKTNGTRGSTFLVEDIREGLASSYPRFLAPNADETLLFFQAEDEWHGSELWVTTGEHESKSLQWDYEHHPKLYDTQKVGKHGGKYTHMVQDLFPGASSSSPAEITPLCGRFVAFTATTPTWGREIWVSNGTISGTYMLDDIKPGSGGSHPEYLTVFDSSIIFAADNGVLGVELWTIRFKCKDNLLSYQNASIVADIQPGIQSSYPKHLIVFEDEQSKNPSRSKVYFLAKGSSQIWETDGTPGGTKRVFQNTGSDLDINGRFAKFDGSLFFSAKKVTTSASKLPLKLKSNLPSTARTNTIKITDIDSRMLWVNVSAIKGILRLRDSNTKYSYITLADTPEEVTRKLNGLSYQAHINETGPAQIKIEVRDSDERNVTSHVVTQAIDIHISPKTDPGASGNDYSTI